MDTRNEKLEAFVNAIREIAPFVAIGMFALAFVVAVVFAWLQVHDLFSVHLQATPFSAVLAACASVGILVAMLAVTFGATNHAVKAVSTLSASAFFGVVLVLVVVKVLFDAANTSTQALRDIADEVLSTAPWLSNAGNIAAVILAAIALIPIGALVGAAKNQADAFASENEARAHYIGNVGKLLVASASIGAAVLFGVSVIGIQPLVAVLLGVLLDTGFIVALQKAEAHANINDHRHAGTWSRWLWVYGILIALMAVETIATFAQNSPTLEATSKDMLTSPIFGLLRTIGLLAFISAIGMSLLTMMTTATSRIRQLRGSAGGDTGAADWLIGKADDWRNFRARLSGSDVSSPTTPQRGRLPLSQPEPVLLPKDAPTSDDINEDGKTRGVKSKRLVVDAGRPSIRIQRTVKLDDDALADDADDAGISRHDRADDEAGDSRMEGERTQNPQPKSSDKAGVRRGAK